MSKSKPIPVKLPDDLIQRLDRVSELTGLQNRSQVIRLCIKSFLDYFDHYGESALPVNWKEILAEIDGRTVSYQRLMKAADKPVEYEYHNKPKHVG